VLIVFQYESKKLGYNKLAQALKLIPVTAENSSGMDYEIRRDPNNDNSSNFFSDVKVSISV